MRRRSTTFMDKVDDGAKPSSATRLAKVAEDERRVASLILIVGCFRTLVIDLPWDYDWLSLAGRAVPGWLRPQDRPDMGQAAAIRSRFLLPQSNRTRALPATRGDLDTRSDSISTVFEAPVGKRSEKPEAFYDIVRRASYQTNGFFGECFQREARPDFKNLYGTMQEIEIELTSEELRELWRLIKD